MGDLVTFLSGSKTYVNSSKIQVCFRLSRGLPLLNKCLISDGNSALQELIFAPQDWVSDLSMAEPHKMSLNSLNAPMSC